MSPAASQSLVVHSLATAMVTSSNSPLLLLDEALLVVAASESFCRAFNVDCDRIVECLFFDLGRGEWNSARLRSLLEVTAGGGAGIDAYEFDLIRHGRPPRRLIVHADKLDYDGGADVRLLLAITDVTETRARDRLKDDLVHESAILLQELQHRIANSLQIIASVLMQSARKTASDETRSHLADAHHRVMSVAEVQRQLSMSSLGIVELCPYLDKLCRAIAASLIHDAEQIHLTVLCDEASIPADSSVSLGLIATELVINSLKHGFPEGTTGRIVVSYRTAPGSWALAITDDGVGMPFDRATTPSGLGMTIVDALARQLKSTLKIDAMNPGTRVSIIGNIALKPLLVADAT